jgi:hypothetical protein
MPWGVHQLNQVYTHLRNRIFLPQVPHHAHYHAGLIEAADNLIDVILGQLPKNSVTANAVEQLMEIYKIEADKATCKARAQRVLREQALAQRVAKKWQEAEPVQASYQHTLTPFLTFEVEDSQDNNPRAASRPPIISQIEDSPLSVNTRQQCQTQTLMQDYIFHMMEVPGYNAPFTPAQAASRKYPLQFLCNFANAILDEDTSDLLEYRPLIKHQKYRNTWSQLFGKEIRCLATTTETIFFITKHQIPKDHHGDVTYGRIVCDVREGKKDKHCTRLTMGGNLINYPDDCGTPMADLLTVKILLNSIISTPKAKFMTIDIKDFYLNKPMERYEYFCMMLELFLKDVIDEYDLCNKVDANENVHCKVRRGMYGLSQAGIIAQDLLDPCLRKARYTQSKITPSYWKHTWSPISFTLV